MFLIDELHLCFSAITQPVFYVIFSHSIFMFILRGGSRAAVTSKMERIAIIFNGWKSLTIILKRFILDVAAALDPPLRYLF